MAFTFRLRVGAGLTLLTMIACGAPRATEAGFVLGSAVTGTLSEVENPQVVFNKSATVADPGVEFSGTVFPTIFGTDVAAIADFTASTIRVGYTYSGNPTSSDSGSDQGIFTFTGINVGAGQVITGLTVLANNRAFLGSGQGLYTYSTTGNSITIDLIGFGVGYISFVNRVEDSITFAVQTSAAVPEPSSLALLGAASLVGVGVTRARQRRIAG